MLELGPLLLHLGVEVAVDGLVSPPLLVETAPSLLLRGSDHVRDGLRGGGGGVRSTVSEADGQPEEGRTPP